MWPSVCVNTLGVRNNRISNLDQHFRMRCHPHGMQDSLATLRPYCSSCSTTAPPWTQDSIRVGGEPLPDGAFTLLDTPEVDGLVFHRGMASRSTGSRSSGLSLAGDDLDSPAQGIFKVEGETRRKPRARGRPDINEEIDIAFGAGLAARDGARNSDIVCSVSGYAALDVVAHFV